MKRFFKKLYLFFYATFLYCLGAVVMVGLAGGLFYATCQPVGKDQYFFGFCKPAWGVVDSLNVNIDWKKEDGL